VCVLLLQEYENRVDVLSKMLLQKDSAADDQQELLTQRLLATDCEASGLDQQGPNSRVVCCNTNYPTPVCLHTATLTARLLGCALFWSVQK